MEIQSYLLHHDLVFAKRAAKVKPVREPDVSPVANKSLESFRGPRVDSDHARMPIDLLAMAIEKAEARITHNLYMCKINSKQIFSLGCPVVIPSYGLTAQVS